MIGDRFSLHLQQKRRIKIKLSLKKYVFIFNSIKNKIKIREVIINSPKILLIFGN